jgi:hypothetical protein
MQEKISLLIVSMQIFRIVAATLALLSLGSCSRLFLVEAALIDGALVFRSSDDYVTFYPWCWNNFTIVDEVGRAVWEFEVPYGAFNDRDECGPNFPIRYGEAPPKAETFVVPKTLVVGKTYVIIGHSAGILDGAFKFERTEVGLRVRNVSPESDTAIRARDSYFAWQQANDPPRVSNSPTKYNPFVEPLPASIPLDSRKGTPGRDEFTWVLGPDEWWNMPSLSYQTLNGEEELFNLWCRYTNAPLYARLSPPALEGTLLKLVSGQHHVTARIIGAGNPGEPSRIDALLPWESAVFQGFADTGSLTIEAAQDTIEMDAINDEELAVVNRFLQLCAGQLPPPVDER